MKIGLVVYSGTGHTWRVAERLKEVLSTAGHSVALERLASVEPVSAIEAEGPSPVSGYEALVFGAPVHGGFRHRRWRSIWSISTRWRGSGWPAW